LVQYTPLAVAADFDHLLRGLFEHKVETQAEIGPHVARTIAFFLAGCRQGGGAWVSWNDRGVR
jgi:hypothetical protein